jgi:hypothetical protein
MNAQAKPKRILKTDQHIALDQALDDLAEKKYSASEFLSTFKPKLERLHNLGYTPKQLAEIVSEKTGETFSQAEIKRVLTGGVAKKPKAQKNDVNGADQIEKTPTANPVQSDRRHTPKPSK